MMNCPEKEPKVRELRKALLNWYPFIQGDKVLLAGRDTALLSEVLQPCFKAVIRADIEKLDSLEKNPEIYDCIIILDLLEHEPGKVRERLCRIAGHLKKDGVFLLGFRNRFGLKYWCGGLDEDVRVPFESIAGQNETFRLFGRQEMTGLLRDAGFSSVRVYYLMPDGDFPQAVYTDEYLPKGSIRDRVFPYDPYKSPFVLSEADLYDDMVREGALPNIANYYLAECRLSGEIALKRHVIYAALSTDRGPEHGFSTVLYSDETACKKALSPEGFPSLEALFHNIEELRSRGILTVAQKLTDEGIEMPLVREEPLLVYLDKILHEDRNKFLDVFEKIYQDVLSSSELSELTETEALSQWNIDREKLGPVLKTAYIDMIPYNAFWADGKIRYYDQEFLVGNCPALYVLFRALRYTWLHLRDAERIIPLNEAKAHFKLTELWDAFQKREDEFVSENRNMDSLRQVYQWADIDRAKIVQRRKKLTESASENYILLRDVHKVQLTLLKKLDQVCRDYGLRYMAVHGTLLGAVRHNGFIPWDDDIDIAMPRQDYDCLLAIGHEVFTDQFFLQTPLNNYGCYYGGYSKLRMNGTAALEPRHQWQQQLNCNQGIWIDIMPLDQCPASENSRMRLQKKLNFLQRIIFAKTYLPSSNVMADVPGSYLSLYYILAKITRRQDLVRTIDRLCRKKRNTNLTGILACYYGSRMNRNIWNAELTAAVETMKFEDMMICVPTGWKEMLEMRYGADFMEIPPESKRWKHSGVAFYPNLEMIENGKS